MNRRLFIAAAGGAADVVDGLIDQGYKDSVLVFAGERLKLLLAATEPRRFMHHYHSATIWCRRSEGQRSSGSLASPHCEYSPPHAWVLCEARTSPLNHDIQMH